MKIALPVDQKTMDSPISPSFGRAPYFLVVDTEGGDFEAVANEAAMAPGGAGIKAAQKIADLGAEVLITYRCGQNAHDVLSAAKIKLMRAVAGTAGEVVALFQEGKLEELTQIHPGFHGRGGM